MKIFFNYIKQIFISLIIIIGILFVSFLTPIVLFTLLRLFIEDGMMSVIFISEANYIYFWLISIILIISVIIPPVMFAVWVYKDSKKINISGFKIPSLIWAIGVSLPTVILVLPIYFIRRNILQFKDSYRVIN